MLCGAEVAVCSQIHTKHIYKMCVQSVQLLNVKPVGASRNQWALKGQRILGRL
jgi:hypothetical protein